MTYNADDYVDVAERIREFYERFPDGRLCAGSEPKVVEIGGKPFVWYHARAYRTADDPVPADGFASEPVPGPTPFTLNSELMNAETSAWGRAIVALGFATKKIASAEEVRNRNGATQAAEQAQAAQPSSSSLPSTVISEPQRKRLYAISKDKGVGADTMKRLLKDVAGVDSSSLVPKSKYEELVAAVEMAGLTAGAPDGMLAENDVPFAPTLDGTV